MVLPDITLDGPIEASPRQFYFDDTNNNPPNVDPTLKANYTNGSGNNSMILSNLSKNYKVFPVDIRNLVSSTNPSSKHKLKEIAIGGKLYLQVNNSFI